VQGLRNELLGTSASDSPWVRSDALKTVRDTELARKFAVLRSRGEPSVSDYCKLPAGNWSLAPAYRRPRPPTPPQVVCSTRFGLVIGECPSLCRIVPASLCYWRARTDTVPASWSAVYTRSPEPDAVTARQPVPARMLAATVLSVVLMTASELASGHEMYA